MAGMWDRVRRAHGEEAKDKVSSRKCFFDHGPTRGNFFEG